MSRNLLLLLALIPAAMSCKGKDEDVNEADADTDADTDSDTDADTDTDTDADTDVTPEDCATAGDEDGDGLADCADSDCATDPSCGCADATWAGTPITGSIVGIPDVIAPGCSSSSSTGDYAIAFTAPTAGEYVFDTVGSSFDTVLSLYSDCAGTEIDCNDDTVGLNLRSRIFYSMAANETVYAYVSGYSTNEGDFVLSVFQADLTETSCDDGVDNDVDNLLDCADDDCEADAICIGSCPDLAGGTTVPATITGTTTGATDSGVLDCSNVAAPDVTVSFTAPADGTYKFALDPTGTTFDAALEVRTGCGASTLIDCDDNFGTDGEDELLLDLFANDQVIVVIDGGAANAAGDFELDITEVPATEISCFNSLDDDEDGLLDCLDDDCAADALCQVTCPLDTAAGPQAQPLTGTLVGLPDSIDASCGSASPRSGTTIQFVATADATYAFGLDATTNFDSILAVYDVCGGTELECEDVTGNQGGEATSRAMTVGQSVIIGIETDLAAPATSDYSLRIWEVLPEEVVCDDQVDDDFDGDLDCEDAACAADAACAFTCPSALLPNTVPSSTSGTTVDGGPNGVDLTTCSFGDAPEQTFQFTAPADGTYIFDTIGSGYDTVIGLFDACGGTELLCNDDGGGNLTSLISTTLTQGQTVILVVDGYNGRTGDFVLNVSQ